MGGCILRSNKRGRRGTLPTYPSEGQQAPRELEQTYPLEGQHAPGSQPRYPLEGRQAESGIPLQPTCPLEGRRADLESRRQQKHRKRLARQSNRNKKWENAARWRGKEKTTCVITWNIQRARTSFPRRNRFAEILRAIAKTKAEVVLFSELREDVRGIKWIKAKELFGVLIQGNKSAVFLRDEWALDWRDQGSKKLFGHRNMGVTVNNCMFIATYQPIWGGDRVEYETYREELNGMILKCGRRNLVVGGDLNASIGNTSHREQSSAAGPFGQGKMNDAGEDLVNWCLTQDLAWANSFFRQNKRGTWKCPGRKSWHEIDGFLVKQHQRSRIVKDIRTMHGIERLTDHLPKKAELWLGERKTASRTKPTKATIWDA